MSEPTATPTSTPTALSPDDQLALSLGRAVLEQLRRSGVDPRLPAAAPAPVDAEGAALEPRPGAPVAPRAPSRRPAPGTATIRAAIRRASDMAVAPPGSELARLRIALLASILCVAAFAVLIVAVVE